MTDLSKRVDQIMRDEAFLTILERYKSGLTAVVMAQNTHEDDRATALSKFHGLIGLENELRSEAFNATEDE